MNPQSRVLLSANKIIISHKKEVNAALFKILYWNSTIPFLTSTCAEAYSKEKGERWNSMGYKNIKVISVFCLKPKDWHMPSHVSYQYEAYHL